MILTGPEIIKAHKNKEIIIEPFLYEHVNPNSYNFRIGNKLRIYTSEELDPKKLNEYEEIEITEEGYLLEPNKLYLAHTIEKMGSNNYAPTFAARSSIARLGLFINLSASLGDIGFIGQWTLQLCATHPLKVYSGMPIGQIMWWKPKGRIELYNGKYQSSNGPRSSEIYMDFNKTKKHTLLPVLGSLVNENIVGNKFNSLSILSKDYLVPKAFCISTEFLEQFMFTAQIKTQLFNEMIDIKSTVGAFIRDSSKKINSIMEDIYINEQGIAIIIERIDEIFGDCNEKGKYAIRSSGTNEDGKQNSYAGIHDSFLNVSGMKNIIKSIEKVVKSYYSATAIIQRVTNGDFSSNPEIAVIVQEMIDSQEAGVAFSEKYNNEIIVSIESVKGLGEQLVSGVVESSKEIVSKENYLEKENNIQKIYSLASSIQEYHGYDVDIEWSILHEKIYLLQCRPITKKTVNDKKENIKQFSFFDLYHENPPKSFEFKEVAEIYVSYTNKRKKSIEIANKYGFKTSLGFVLNYNKLGLQDFKFNSNKLLENMFKNKEVNSYSKFVLDFNQFSRQIIIEKEELVDNLLQHLPKDSDFITNTVIIRPFFSGEAGLIVSSGELGMFIDISEKGLLSLNRGIIESSKITFNEKHEIINISSNCPHYIIDAVKKNQLNLANCVNEINSEFNTTTTEWIYEKGIFCFIDYSNKGKVNYENIINTSIISRGAAKGKIFDLTKYSEELHRLSIGAAVSIDDEKTLDLSYHQVIQEIIEELEKYKEKPIVLAKLPYACLSGILNIASGFIFEKGSTLCHLAILLRENDIPAVVANRKIKSEEVTIIEGNIYEK